MVTLEYVFVQSNHFDLDHKAGCSKATFTAGLKESENQINLKSHFKHLKNNFYHPETAPKELNRSAFTMTLEMVLNSVSHRNANVFQRQLSLIICHQTLSNSSICLVERCLDV